MEFREWIDNELANDIWTKKYQFDGESFDEWLDRVSNGDNELKELILNKKFLFGGRILSNRGLDKRGRKVTYSNCYVLDAPEDSIESIFDTAGKLARTFSYGGGVGVDLKNLRPKGASVNNSAKETTGAVSFMDLYSLTTGLIGQNGRRGALMLSMPIDHPDIEEFIDVKKDLDKVTYANISVRIDDKFMEAVKNNEDYLLSFLVGVSGEYVTKVVNARDLFMKLCENNWNMAEPGILYWDAVNTNTLLSEYIKHNEFEYAGTNPCLHGDTIIKTTDGDFTISELVGKQVDVFAMDDNGELCIKKATKIWKTRENAQLVKIVHYRGELICTPDHEIYTRNRGWVKAKDLKPKDRLNGLGISMKDEKHSCYKLSSDRERHSSHRFILGHYENIDGKDVHHIDGDPLNNTRANLESLSHSTHSVVTNVGHECYANRDSDSGMFVGGKTGKRSESKQINKEHTGKNFIVKEVIELDYTADVYDMTVEDVHNFIANDIIVHNCAEEPLPPGGSCLLGSINLSAHCERASDGTYAFNIPELKHTVKQAVYALDEVLDEGLPLHPLPIQRETVRDWRQIGLGIMGFADACYKLGIAYGSEACIDFIDTIGAVIKDKALYASAEIASNKGAFPMYDVDRIMNSEFLKGVSGKTYTMIEEHGLAHSQLLTIAPTGSISTMLGISGGVEPIFSLQYTRRTLTLHDEEVYYTVTIPILEEILGSYASSTIGTDEEVPLPDYIITSHDIAPVNRCKVQGAWQKYIDASISSTVNMKESSTVDDVYDVYMTAWECGCKGITIYRDNCSRQGILTVGKKEDESTIEHVESDGSIIEPRGTIHDHTDDAIGLIRRIQTGCGSLWLNVFFDKGTHEISDIFLSKGSKGGCQSFMIGLSRMISLSARAGVTPEIIIDQLRSVPACPSYVVGKAKIPAISKGTCCPSAIANAIENIVEEYRRTLHQTNAYTIETEDKHRAPLIDKARSKEQLVDDESVFSGCRNGH